MTTRPALPAGFKPATRGLILNFGSADVDAEHERLVVKSGLKEILTQCSEALCQRHFITRDPNGMLTDVIAPISPAEDAEQFAG